MPNIIIHPTRFKISRCQQELLRAGDGERSKDWISQSAYLSLQSCVWLA